ncbi:MAG: hypothetical protein SFW09_17985 [Hyphomicrobiaceae bacterium]|nr:hypothetical protein [Hyphomicrobiaceae bacterium]
MPHDKPRSGVSPLLISRLAGRPVVAPLMPVCVMRVAVAAFVVIALRVVSRRLLAALVVRSVGLTTRVVT